MEADVEIAELTILHGDFVEAHFVNDFLDVLRVVGKERHAPFELVQTGRSRDELTNFSRLLAAQPCVATHQLAAEFMRFAVPIVDFAPSL